jgi:ABC-type branched-subunit amino acid transport system ATPase component
VSSNTASHLNGPGPEEETLRLESVTVRFGGLTALADISLAASRGELVGLIGPNGSGKTTMLNVIAGMVRPSAGHVLLGRVPCTRASVHRRVRMGLARTFQRAGLFPELTVAQHLALAREAKDLWSRQGATNDGGIDVDGLVAHPLWGLKPDQRVSALPLGAVRVVELAMALTGTPRVLLLDEPLSGLDQAERAPFGLTLLDVRDRYGVTVLLIEHDVDSVVRLAERLVVLDFGVKIADGRTAEIIRDPKVRQAYFGGAGA